MTLEPDRRPVRGALVAPVVRIAAGTTLGLVALALLGGTALARDGGLAWLVLDVVLLVVAATAVASGYLAMREAHARSSFVRAWVTMGATALLILLLLISLD
jgi:hypothetical protein